MTKESACVWLVVWLRARFQVLASLLLHTFAHHTHLIAPITMAARIFDLSSIASFEWRRSINGVDVAVFQTPEAASGAVAQMLAASLKSCSTGVALGLATGATPVPLYRHLVSLHKVRH
jgi:hypothetical protein